MAKERWYVDGWELTQGVVRGVEFRNGLNVAPSPRGVNATVPNRTGEIWARKQHAAGTFTLNMWFGTNDGADVYGYWQDFLRAVAHVHRMPSWQRIMPDGESRLVFAEVMSQIEPVHLGDAGIRAGVECRIPGGYWRSDTEYTMQTAASSTLSKTLALTSLEPSTAPMEALECRIAGPITNPQVVDITDGADGDSFTWNGTVPNGATLIVNSRYWSVTGTGMAATDANLLATGPRFLTVPAARPGQTPTVQLRGSGGGGNTRLTVVGHRAYL